VRCPDADGDGFGARPAGSERGAGNCTDCDDGNAAIHPWARELCNGIDDDCDGVVDPPDASSAPLWYPDADGDGYTLHTDHVRGCTCPAGYARKSTKKDCDDGHALVHPGAHDQPDNGIDEDCSGADATTRDRDVAVRIRSGEASREEVVAYVDDADDRRRLGDVPVPDPGMRDRLVEFVLHEGPAGIHKLYDKTVNGLSFLTHSDIVKEDCARRVLEARRRPEGDPPKCPTAPLQYYLTQDRTWCVPKELDSCEAETRTHQDGRKP
jgi:hypothetical protein